MTQTSFKQLDLDELRQLAHLKGPCVTLQIPDSHPGAGAGARSLVLRQLTQTAVQSLGHLSRMPRAEPLAKALKTFVATIEAGGGDGFTIFVAPGLETVFETRGVAPSATVASHFHVVPLIAIASAAKDFYSLGVSRNAIRLWRVGPAQCEEAVLPHSVPASLEAAGGFDRADHDLENRSTIRGGGAPTRTVRFGTLSDHDVEAEYLHHFFELVARGLRDVVHEAPIFLIGTRPDTLAFRRAAHGTNLFEAEWHANPIHATAAQVEVEARAATAKDAYKKAEAAFAPVSEIREKISGDGAVKKAAAEGRVRQLFVAESARAYASPESKLNQDLYPGEDMLNAAAAETLRAGGAVFVMPGEKLPNGEAITAVLRY